MTAIRSKCWCCEDPDGLMYGVRDITRVGTSVGVLGLCDRCRDLLATGWASLHPVGVQEPARP